MAGWERGISAWENILGKELLQRVSLRERIKTSRQDRLLFEKEHSLSERFFFAWIGFCPWLGLAMI